MRPLKLKLHNFTAFRAPAELDFGPLELYAIEGPTGSGKSSLLDAITFALYGEVPRLGGKGLDALISTGESRLTVELEFEVGEERYRVVRTKGRKQAQSEVRFVRLLENNGEQTVAQETKKKDLQAAITKVLGLSLESFKRSILLPQGEFDRFLKGSGRERQELLGSLIGLERFQEMGRWAGERARTLDLGRKSLVSRLEGEYAGVTREAREQLEGVITHTRAQRQACELQSTALQAQLEELRTLENLHERGVKLEAQWAVLEAVRPHQEALEGRVREARRVSGALPLLENLELAEKRTLVDGIALESARVALQDAEGRGQRAEGVLAQATARVLEIPVLEARLTQLQVAQSLETRLGGLGGNVRLSHANPLEFSEEALERARALEVRCRALEADEERFKTQQAELLELESRVTGAREKMGQLVTRKTEVIGVGKLAREVHDALEARAAQLSSGQALASRLAALKLDLGLIHPDPLEWTEGEFEAARGAQSRWQDAHKEWDALEELRHISKDREERNSGLKADLERVRARETEILSGWQAVLSEKSEFDLRLERARLEDRAAGLRPSLRLGTACPVCEQSVAVLPQSRLSEVSALESRTQELEQSRLKFEGQQKQLEAEYRLLESTLWADERALLEERSKLEIREFALEQLRLESGNVDPNETLGRLFAGLVKQVRGLTNGEDFGKLFARVKKEHGAAREKLENLRAEIQALEAEHSKLSGGLERDELSLVSGRENASQSRALLEGERRALGQVQPSEEVARLLAGLAGQVREITAGARVDALRVGVQAQIQALRDALETARQASGEAQQARSSAQSRLENVQTRLSEAREVVSRLEVEFARVLAGLDLQREDLRGRSLSESEILVLEAEFSGWREALGVLERTLEALKLEWNGRTYDAVLHLKMREEAALVAQTLVQLAGSLGALEGQDRALEAALGRKRELQKECAGLGQKYDTYATLSQSLRSDAFPAYLLEEIEAELLARAGELLFEISDGRYRLALEDGDYAVTDDWNSGETRGVRTLSGGETFLASLALAISLSDYLAGNRRLGALFLDEGFGTLDPEALEAVAGALERLQVTGRMVGVITHVPSLAERLPARVRVLKGQSGSRLVTDV